MPSFRLVDPDFDQAGSCNVVILVTKRMRLTQRMDKLTIVLTKFNEHVFGRNKLLIVVFKPLVSADVTDGPNGHAADLARSFRNVICDGEDLIGMFIEQQV